MSGRADSIASDWFHVSFDALYPLIYAHRTVEAAEPEAKFSIERTAITSGDSVLDLCCGSGRHMAHLVNCAARVVGLDYSPELLRIARETLGSKVALVRADMRSQPFHETFDVVVNYFTSFGYFPSREENLSVVRQMALALKPGGRFFIDYMNRTWTENNIQPESSRSVSGYDIKEKRWIDPKQHRVNKTVTIFKEGQEIGDSGESVQLYTQDEFSKLLTDGGLTVEHMYGDYTGADLDAKEPRMIAVGRKT